MDETVPHGEIIHLPELVKAAGDMHDRSVRTIGRCDGHATIRPPRSWDENTGTLAPSLPRPLTVRPLLFVPAHPRRLVSYDAATARATIALDGASILVDVANVPSPDPHRIDSLYQYIGEIDAAGGGGGGDGGGGAPCLRARVARCVDGLDLKLYAAALRERNRFLGNNA